MSPRRATWLRALLVPRVGALAGDAEPRLDPLAARADVLVMELGPDLLLGPARRPTARTCAPCPASQTRIVQRMSAISSGLLISRACSVSSWPSTSVTPCRRSASVPGGSSLSTARRSSPPPARSRSVATSSTAQRSTHSARFSAGVQVEPGQRRAHLVDRLEALGEVCGGRVLEVDRVAVGEDERAVDRAVGGPHLHVRDVERVADVDRVVEQDRRAVVGDDLLDQCAAFGMRGLRRASRAGWGFGAAGRSLPCSDIRLSGGP